MLFGAHVDHHLCFPSYFAPEETVTLDPIFWNDNNGIESKSSSLGPPVTANMVLTGSLICLQRIQRNGFRAVERA